MRSRWARGGGAGGPGGSQVHTLRVIAQSSSSVGGTDSFAFTGKMNRPSGSKVGVFLVQCQANFTTRKADCDATFALRGGEFLGHFVLPLTNSPKPLNGTITGGTRGYRVSAARSPA